MSRTLHGVAAALAVLLASSTAAFAQDPSGKLVVVTSFPKDLTSAFQQAFQKAYPKVTLEVLNRNTNAGVKYLQETASNNGTDLFWASAPDAFEVLKGANLLQAYKPKVEGIPEKVGAYPINDPEGMYAGFAASGYGIMWNSRYMKANELPAPKEWSDLAKPVYYDHVAISAPSRSGTTHLTIETILQGEGWEKGWRTNKEIAGNYRTITERSFGVPDGVNSGSFGIGIVIDFFALSSQASGFPVEFVYPTVTTIVPANIGIVKNAPNKAAAETFVDFILSPQGQEVLLQPAIRRLPVNPATYAKAPADYPNPFKDTSLGSQVNFDVEVSQARYNVVDALFDQLITFQLDGLKAATRAIHQADAALAKKPNDKAKALLAEARDLVAAMPVTAQEAADPQLAGAFTVERKTATDAVPERQAQVEQKWAAFAKDNYAAARKKAEEALALAR
ncbi:extracellular solute-binding protein [Azospirillum brasilense]|uniref:Extracellular solute-binding protein n=1 Tax=Azospirillum brasilense TaxID=192 RepID=A0A0P0F5U2_AZOBR|nr:MULTISPECIES: extracellular solute-binding protein [Azospirillum]ALJ38458.1 ABC transporter substrate-binding protein [Azospirillum brasilense]MDW7553107.1 extracellular solute-binding protein [Azospirillum brasilense]MDW7593515.1 extracellular solute-binding protein [Azospirillum brasilense]MDW7628426.1 extracellular solute-binding protein [Azospirillum brasilense]MDX5955479.1 extracellular solute-binding protein [Azospirillum brasilense]